MLFCYLPLAHYTVIGELHRGVVMCGVHSNVANLLMWSTKLQLYIVPCPYLVSECDAHHLPVTRPLHLPNDSDPIYFD